MTAPTDKREPLSASELEAIAARHPEHPNPYFEPASFAPIRRLLAEHAARGERIAELEAERDAARYEVERLRGHLLAVAAGQEDGVKHWLAAGMPKAAASAQRIADHLRAVIAAPQPSAEPVAVEADPDAPLDAAALPAFWDARRARLGRPDKSTCAAELRRAHDSVSAELATARDAVNGAMRIIQRLESERDALKGLLQEITASLTAHAAADWIERGEHERGSSDHAFVCVAASTAVDVARQVNAARKALERKP